MNKDENEYTEKFNRRLQVNSPEVFGNFSSKNADYIILRFIESAKESVSLFTDRIPGDACCFHNAIRTAATNIVKYNTKKATGAIRIITVDGEKHPDLIQAAKEINSQLHRKVISVIETKYSGEKVLNSYTVVDLRRYRLEDTHKPFKGTLPEIVKAEVSCNGPGKAFILESSFNRLWNSLKDKATK